MVAVGIVRLKPDLFAAFVGTGQVVSWKATSDIQYDLLLAMARKDGDTDGWRNALPSRTRIPKQFFAATGNLR